MTDMILYLEYYKLSRQLVKSMQMKELLSLYTQDHVQEEQAKRYKKFKNVLRDCLQSKKREVHIASRERLHVAPPLTRGVASPQLAPQRVHDGAHKGTGKGATNSTRGRDHGHARPKRPRLPKGSPSSRDTRSGHQPSSSVRNMLE